MKLVICFSVILVKYIMFSDDLLYSFPLFLRNSKAAVHQILVILYRTWALVQGKKVSKKTAAFYDMLPPLDCEAAKPGGLRTAGAARSS